MSEIKLRDYQIECLNRIKNYLDENIEKRIILCYLSMGARQELGNR